MFLPDEQPLHCFVYFHMFRSVSIQKIITLPVTEVIIKTELHRHTSSTDGEKGEGTSCSMIHVCAHAEMHIK